MDFDEWGVELWIPRIRHRFYAVVKRYRFTLIARNSQVDTIAHVGLRFAEVLHINGAQAKRVVDSTDNSICHGIDGRIGFRSSLIALHCRGSKVEMSSCMGPLSACSQIRVACSKVFPVDQESIGWMGFKVQNAW